MPPVVTYPIVRSSLVFDHCRVREIVIKKRIRLGVVRSEQNYASMLTLPADLTAFCV